MHRLAAVRPGATCCSRWRGPQGAPRAETTAPAAPEQIPTWSQVEASPKYEALDSAGKESVRMSFWRDVVSPRVPTPEIEQARKEFDERTKPSLVRRAGALVSAAGEALKARRAPTDLPDISGEAALPPPAPTQAEPVAPPPAEMPARLRAQQEMGSAEAEWFSEHGVLTNAPAGMVAAGKNAVANLGRMAYEEAAQARADPTARTASGFRRLLSPAEIEHSKASVVDAQRAGEEFKTWSEQTKKELELVTPKDEMSTMQQAVWSFIQSTPPTALGITVGIITRNPVAAMAIAGGGGSAFQAGATYGEASDKGAPHDLAARAAFIDGVLEGVGEAIPLRVALKPGSQFLKRLANTIGQEAGQEGITQLAQDLNAYLSYDPNITLQEAWQNFKVGVLAGGIAGGVYGVVGAAADTTPSAPQPSAPAPEQPPAAPPLAGTPSAAPPVETDPAALSRMIAGEEVVPPAPPAGGPAVAPEPGARDIDVSAVRGLEEPAESIGAPPEPTAAPAAPISTQIPPAEPPAVQAAQPQAAEKPAEKPATPVREQPLISTQLPAQAAEKPPAPPRPAEPPPPPGSRPAVAPVGLEEAAAGLKQIFESPVDEAAHAAATSPANELPQPTEPQKEAGNYQKGHVRIGGLDISIENPEGSKRRPEWPTLKSHYGYIRGTRGKDKDHIDAFIKPGTPEEIPDDAPIYVIDQRKPGNGHFDEHKVMIGFASEEEARRAYMANYEPGWRGLGAVTRMGLDEFHEWLETADTTLPAAQVQTHADLLREIESEIRGRGKGNATQLPDDDIAGFEKLLEERGWERTPFGKSYVHVKDGWDVFTRAQGKLAKPIVQWGKHTEPIEDEGVSELEGAAKVKKEKTDAGAIRSDQGQVQGEGRTGEGGEKPGGRDLQQPAPVKADEQRAPEGRAAQEPETPVAGEALSADQVKQVAELFADGISSRPDLFKSITEARAWIGEKLGRPIKPGTIAAKQVDEAIELGIVLAARKLISQMRARDATDKEIYAAMVDLYKRQPNLGVRTSTSIRDQAYSTPVPLAFLASRLAGIGKDTTVYEPTAGNGMLLIEAAPAKVSANELNDERYEVLKAQGFAIVKSFDASEQGPSKRNFDVVIANPPFGYVKDDSGGKFLNKRWKIDEQYTTNQIDHAISLKALEAMKDDGRAVLIVAAPHDMKKGETRADAYNGKNLRAFYFTLYRDYNVVDHFTVSGDLYAKQGAAWPVDVVVIRGRGKSAKGLPAADLPPMYESWGALQEKLDARYAARSAEDRRQGEGAARGELGADARDEARPVAPGDVGPAAVERGPGGPGPVRGGPVRGQPGAAGPAEGTRTEGGAPGERGQPRGAGEQADVGQIFDEEFAKLFGDVEKAPARGDLRVRGERVGSILEAEKRHSDGDLVFVFHELDEEPHQIVNVGELAGYTSEQVLVLPQRTAGEAAASAARETGAGIEDIAKGLEQLFGGKGRLGSGLQFDEETYAKAKPFLLAGVQHFKQAGQDVREAIRLLLIYLREKAAMTAEAINRMKPYVVRFVEELRAGKIQLEEEPARAPVRPKELETEHQTAYEPRSGVDAIGTLVPVNMKDSISGSLDALKEKVGDLDQYVAKELDYAPAKLGRYFSAEQVDALAQALDGMKGGAGYIIGDATGVGKGRVVAGVIRWAMKNGKTPIFVTEKPNLYKDIYRDLADIGMPDVTPVMTNAGESIPLTDDGSVVLKAKSGKDHNAHLQELIAKGSLGDYDVIFTTYSQMQTIKGGQRTARMDFLEAFSRGGVVIFDESHNAGGNVQAKQEVIKSDPTRADFARGIARMAESVFYSSATYAKRPEVMDLYFKTDMGLAVENSAALPAAIRAGGVPLQQVVAAMLAKAGQYIRRERSFAGVTYNTEVTPVNRQVAERMSSVMRRVAEFDQLKAGAVAALKKTVRAEAKTMTQDGSIGMAGVHSTNFTSIMHNMVDQMLLALKVVPAAQKALEAVKRGEKPVLTVANTMGSFIEHYVEDHGLNTGDAVDISFRDLLLRYLERSRDVTIGNAFGKKQRHRLSDDELGLFATQAWDSIKKDILQSDFSDIPLSPIDYLKAQVVKAGLSFGEITGRQHLIDYTGDVPTYRLRPGREISIRGRNETILGFNSGKLDVLLINQAGATGLSLHASEKFKDQRRRHMVIVQPERNIDIHMQMLGRVHRTGQVIDPVYTQLVADIPAEKRPAAVLAKKMASLNANTTAARGSAVTSKDVVDFMNEYGDEVAAQLMEDNPDWHRKMGSPLKNDESGSGLEREEAIRKLTGRIPLLTIAEQETLYDLIESEYLALIDEKDRMGENALEAKTLPLEAKVKKVVPVTQGRGGTSPFAQGAQGEIVDVKKLGKPYTSVELVERIRLSLEAQEGARLTELKSLGAQRVNATRDELESEFKDYLQQELDGLHDQRHREATQTRLDAAHTRLDAILAQSGIGRQVVLTTRYGKIPAVVTMIEKKGKPKNPAALGAWKITYAVADAIRHVTLPASRLITANRAPASAVDTGLVVIEEFNPAEFEGKRILQLFDEAQTVTREDRVIVTGNLLAGFGKFANGRIINYTTDDGATHQGILMPAKFDIDKSLNEMPVEFPDAATAIGFLESLDGKPVVESVDEKVFRIAKLPGEDVYRISVAAARERGGIIYLNPKVLEAAGTDFVKAGSSMRVELPKTKAIATLQAILHQASQRVHTQAFRQEAKDYLAKQPPVVRAAPTMAVRPSEWLSAEEVEQKVADLSKRFAHKPYVRVLGRPSEVFPGAGVHDWTPGFTVNQKIYLARSALTSLDEVEVTYWHELFHYGVRRFMTKEQYISAMDRLYRSNSEVARRADVWMSGAEGRIVRANQGEAYGRARGVDEALAALAEQLKGMTEEQVFGKASVLDNAVMAIVRWAADVAERFGAERTAARIRAYTNENAIRFVSRIFSRLAMNEAAVSGPGSYSDIAFMQRPVSPARRSMARDTSLTDKILSAPFKLAKWDAMAEGAWEKARELNERATEASPFWETVRAGVESDFGLEEPYLDRRVEMQVNLQKWARGAVTMLDKLTGLSRDESRVAYEWMHDRDADHLIEELPEESKRTLREIKELIRSLGEEAVRLGQLSQEVFERNELAYLHRSYLKHEIEPMLAQRLGNRKSIALWAEQYKGRGLKDWRTQGELNAWAGEAIDPRTMKGKMFHRLELRARVPADAVSRLEALGGHRPLGRLRKVVYWPEGKEIPGEYAGWHNDGLWEVRWFRGGKWGLWRDLTKEEREALGEIDEVRFGVAKTLHLMTHDIEMGRMQVWVAQNYAKDKLEPGEREVSANESMAATFGRHTWVKVPSTEVRGTNVKKYGALAGKYVPGPVWNDIRQHISLDSKPGQIRKLWDDAMRMWKISKTALSPGVHMNNVMANVFIADFHDLRSKDLIKAIRVLVDAKTKNPSAENKALYERFEDSGALHGMFKYHELKAEALDPLLEEIRNEALNDETAAMTRVLSLVSWLNAIQHGGKKVAGAMIEAYGAEDEVFRLAIFIKATRHGLPDIEAGRLSRKAFLDYDINAPWIQALRRTAFPFIAFPYRAIPMMIDTFTNKPWKLVKYVGLAAILNSVAYAMLGLTDDDEERERRLLHEEKAGKIWGLFPKMIRMPWNREGNPVFLDVRRWFPSGDIFDVGYTNAVIPWSPAALPGGPVALLAEIFTNRAQFTGTDITLETDTGWEKAGKLGMHLYRFAAPNLFMIPGTWSFEGLRGAMGFGAAGPQTDVFGREFSVPQAFASALGIKLGTYPEDVLRYNLVRRTQVQVNEIMGNIYRATSDRARSKMTDEELREYVVEQMKKVKRLQDEAGEKLAPPARP
jgi:predicted RNA methylase